MLIIGNKECLNKIDKSNLVILNLSSLSSQFTDVDLLPKIKMDIEDSYKFDVEYANYIMNNDYRFMEFMKIIYNLYGGNNIYLLVSKSSFHDIISESLSKFIQQRYGYNTNVINDISDMEILEESSFSIQGLYNLDIDKERYSYILAQNNLIE